MKTTYLFLFTLLLFSFHSTTPSEDYIRGQVDYAEGRHKIKPHAEIFNAGEYIVIKRGYIDHRGEFWVIDSETVNK